MNAFILPSYNEEIEHHQKRAEYWMLRCLAAESVINMTHHTEKWFLASKRYKEWKRLLNEQGTITLKKDDNNTEH